MSARMVPHRPLIVLCVCARGSEGGRSFLRPLLPRLLGCWCQRWLLEHSPFFWGLGTSSSDSGSLGRSDVATRGGTYGSLSGGILVLIVTRTSWHPFLAFLGAARVSGAPR
jgi:hypothetical protein